MITNRLANAVVVALLVAFMAACGGNPNGPTKCTDSLASNNGQAGTCTYAPVNLTNLVYHRTEVSNPTKTADISPSGLIRDDNLVCPDIVWNVPSQNWACAELKTFQVGALNKMWVSDIARAIFTNGVGVSGSDIVCSNLSINGTMLKPTKEGSREFCYFKVDAQKNVTSTDAAGNPK